MHQSRTVPPSEIDFWLDSDKYHKYSDSDDVECYTIDMVRLASIRAAISNFIRILTRKAIPVYFCDAPSSFNYAGKSIYITAKIYNKREFDVAVGLALHEGSHTLLTDFDVVKNTWANIPHHILKLADSKNIRRASLEKFLHGTWNVIEDRYIDTYVFNEAPGYRGYYVAMYEEMWNSPKVDEYLISDQFRYPSLKSYDFRITNFTNENTDLLALPRLDEIAQIFDISHINRLDTTKKRIETAFKITEVVLECIDKQETLEAQGKGKPRQKQRELADPRDYFDFGDDEMSATDENGESGPSKKSKSKNDKESEGEEIDVGKKMIEEISDVITGRDKDPGKLNENDKAVNQISYDSLDKEIEKDIDKMMDKQRQFLRGDVPKQEVTEYQKALLDLIEKHGITIVQVPLPLVVSGNETSLKIDCVVVHKMTKELILSGQSVFPMSGIMQMDEKDVPSPPKEVADAVRNGIMLGTKLGRKLQIRAEVHPIKNIRKKNGKINRRQLHEAAFDAEDLFYKTNIEEHHDANLHITVDASTSMARNRKWEKTMTAVVAICKAASMIDNVHITVSFRTTQVSGRSYLPYVILAYDSKVDKFAKIKTLFPYLVPNGCTPEGLAFGAIMNLFEGITPDEEDRFFLNLSDGEPYFALISSETGLSVSYSGEIGVSHTKSQVDKIRRRGIQILSYFISDNEWNDKNAIITPEEKKQEENPLQRDFRTMYGKSAQFIRVNEIVDLARTINGLFLTGASQKST